MTLDYQPHEPRRRSSILGRLSVWLNIPALILVALDFSPLNPVTTHFMPGYAFDDWILWTALCCGIGLLLGIASPFQRNTDLNWPLAGIILSILLAIFLPSLAYA